MRLFFLQLLLSICYAVHLANADCQQSCSCANDCNICTEQSVTTLCLRGNKTFMGYNYGVAMKQQLAEVKEILINHYVVSRGIPYGSLLTTAQLWHDRYAYHFTQFLKGIAKGSGLSFDDVQLVNAMVSYHFTFEDIYQPDQLVRHSGGCAFFSLPPSMTSIRSDLLGRNYDFPKPFDQISKFLTVTILIEPDLIPTAFISNVGEIYCENCLNSNGLFLELNNGGPSGGFGVNSYREDIMAGMLDKMQKSSTFWHLQQQILATQSDIALIWSAASANQSATYEFTPFLGMSIYQTAANTSQVATNYFQSDTWGSLIPPANDFLSWNGITRAKNLRRLLAPGGHNFDSLKLLMEKTINEGGAKWNDTAYQLLYDPDNSVMWLKTRFTGGWKLLDFKQFWSTV